ncbi:methionine--tRNA ligase subunit beta [Candidatus Desantisbacteria bacterium CG2_30_40_21]|uniref:Methionine--tRNA ligase n=5 Tax=unclassified Candidatus Desantisiibacteriota TaxID=3106372 RepID=A0A2M7J8V3_9BACT|nr:MAG: methionine--tRNA ligase subunit beta [Candidatus Desantisbacteria bacterium CG2_30_40_21]PIP39492.1 MAG: methionine--tRNA ligase subunit beta [Candidatus Desantisbacteria bacterium CG23_combo_of_CG06-09_8_20_14_all_40_23]PIX15826.1 MAG: methionine--tRNA ligase subunit beta [Candidatus Desantisbacteria bacterium CG_4_8_14_3_um_filter_40_12]PIY19478.1 MAG: methionine--tRNA ligase subunit beta [Candidatus Desantisbacteria bacterium CG_4_10_14_3_um_filter_40_18]PJB28769.1 MAG: methionine--t
MVTFDDFKKIEIRIGKIMSAQRVEGTDKLMQLEVDIGEERRQIVAGIAHAYTPEEIIGKEIPVLINLEPRKLRGIESQGMILAAIDGEMPVLLHPAKEVLPGSMVR